MPPQRKAKIWIDLDNTPHVLFFEPIIEELTARGFPLIVTARDAFQVCELADKKGLSYTKVGRHHGKNRALKVAGLIFRALQLSAVEHREKPALAVSHGARSQILLSNLLRIPTILIEDYEHSRFPRTMRPTWIMAPDMIPDTSLSLKDGHVRKYSGIKEDVYAWKLSPDPSLLRELGLNNSDVIVTVRPPATEAHYHNPESLTLFERFMDRACQTPGVKVVLLPRNQKQCERLRHDWPAWFEHGKTIVPSAAIDGLNLIWHSDLVVSGGGTMNREAAALGVPVFSIFRGTIGAVDHHLSKEGRLVLVESLAEVETIPIVKRPIKAMSEITSKRTLNQVVDTIQEIAESCTAVP
jgi:predicted glycosyltransferase